MVGKTAFVSNEIFALHDVSSGAVLVDGGVIVDVVGRVAIPADYTSIEHDGAILPGFIDAHVHVNEPGRTEWEGFETATKAAAVGGVTTVLDMPLNSSPVTTDLAALAAKRTAASGKLWVDVGLYAGAVAGNAAELAPLLEAGCIAAKCFMIDSGIDEFAWVDEASLRGALDVLAGTGVPLLAHAEVALPPIPSPSPSQRDRDKTSSPSAGIEGGKLYQNYLNSRPPAMEVAAVQLLIDLCREYQTPIHIVHVSAAEVLPLIVAAKDEGLPITAETCPHYLYFAAEQIPDGATQFKCAPPIRGAANRELLWQALVDGTLDLVASDHSPCSPSLKALETGDFGQAWGGISSLQFGPAVTWTGMRERGIGLAKLAEWWSAQPAKMLGIGNRKGKIAAGMDADLVLWDAGAAVDTIQIWHKHKLTPYRGCELVGRAAATIVRGNFVQSNGKPSANPLGELIQRS